MPQLVKAKYRIRIKPNKRQLQQIMQFAGCSRFVYNHLLSIQNELYKSSSKLMNTKEMEAEIKTLKEEFDWLNDSSAVALQQSRIDLQRAFTNFFKGCKGKYKQKYGYPKFKSRHSQISFRVPSNNGKVAIQDKNLKIPKIGLVKIKTRHMPEFLKLTSATVIIEPSGKVYASLTVEKYVTQKTQTGENAGIDLGLESFITLSNGIKIPPFNYAKSNRNKIASMDRKLSKMRDKLKKVSIDYENASNYQAYKKKVAKYKTHIANKRKDALNKLTTQLVTKYDFIAVEDLNVKGMSKNHRLAYAIQDASWSMFTSMLEYKCKWYGKVFHKINRFKPTSTLCSSCGTKHKETVNSLDVREWVCPDCGTHHDRDVNAAVNILTVGINELVNTRCG